MQFEYVASGLGHTRILQKSIIEGSGSSLIDGMIKKMQGRNGHDYSCLFNAHTEKSFGPQINSAYKNWYKIHSDSGGLQIITQGLMIDDDMKDQVYDVQSQYSDIAMSFDEIPIILTGETSGRNDVDNRFFDDVDFRKYAVSTGLNIRRQLEFILERQRFRCKPLLIIQGNCIDTYKEWLDVLLETIPDSLHQYIGGISLGAAGLGTGTLEDIERTFAFTQLEAPEHIKSVLHILGIGSARRLLPCIMMRKAGLMDGVHVSYDSTTHTSGANMGHFYSYDWQRIQKFPINFSSFAKQILRDIKDNFGLDPEPGFFIDAMRMNNATFAEKYTGADEVTNERNMVIFGFIASSILNFTHVVHDLIHDEKVLQEFVQKEKMNPILHLQDVQSYNDWTKWVSRFGKKLRSMRVRTISSTQAQNNLFDFA